MPALCSITFVNITMKTLMKTLMKTGSEQKLIMNVSFNLKQFQTGIENINEDRVRAEVDYECQFQPETIPDRHRSDCNKITVEGVLTTYFDP